MKFPAVILLSLAATLTTAQDKPLSKAECQADVIAWNVTADGIQKLQDGPLGMKEISARATVMWSCHMAYMPPLEESSYRALSEAYSNAAHVRLLDFLGRHPEIKAKFLEEDGAGLR